MGVRRQQGRMGDVEEDDADAILSAAADDVAAGPGEADADEELEKLKAKWQEMEEEAKALCELGEKQEADDRAAEGKGSENKEEVDNRSVYVGNVDYYATPEELQNHFQSCGTINRVTIICDRYTGNPKGYAYIEFQDKESVESAVLLNEKHFRERELKVTAKRTNVPGKGKGKGKYKGGKGYGKGRKGRKGSWYHPYWQRLEQHD